ncbi:aspartic peptidase domain-containing protein [Mycena albidolilacea]|uniref:Aspartic peptidase domain-containing protein n=1 Tax=Mycena albidolilacea TaxID=1033008 RepID=A0AAD6Z210_9AGAR|nr:aspartic peptidase domain-containing protein [Mycena albidolilacea]
MAQRALSMLAIATAFLCGQASPFTLPHSLQRRSGSTDVSLSRTPGQFHSSFYLTEMTFGTPAQKFKMYLDTILPDFWVVSPCDVVGVCDTTVPSYDPTKSKSFVNESLSSSPSDVYIAFSGWTYADTITLVNLDFNSLKPGPLTASGSLGLGFPPKSPTTNTSFWRALLAEQQGTSLEFGLWVSRPSNSSDKGAVLTLGGTNSSFFTGDVEFLDLNQTNSWALNISDLSVQGTSLKSKLSSKLAVFDVASSFIWAPKADADAFWAAVPGSTFSQTESLYQWPCSTPINITVSFGGETWTLNSDDLNLVPIASGDQQCYGALTAWGSFSLSEYAVPDADWVFGLPFLRNVYSVFRETPPAMGFAALSVAAGGTPSTTTTSSPPSSTGGSSSGENSNPPPAATSSKHKSNTGVIVGSVIAGVLVLAALLSCVFFLRSRKRRSQEQQLLEDKIQEAGASVPRPFPPPADTPQTNLEPNSIEPILQNSSTRKERKARLRSGSQSATSPGVVSSAAGISNGTSPPAPETSNASASAGRGDNPALLQELETLRQELREARWLVSDAPPPEYDIQNIN